jgi:hypothetical protein
MSQLRTAQGTESSEDSAAGEPPARPVRRRMRRPTAGSSPEAAQVAAAAAAGQSAGQSAPPAAEVLPGQAESSGAGSLQAGTGFGAAAASGGSAPSGAPVQDVGAQSLVVGLGEQRAETLSANPMPRTAAGIAAAGSHGAELAAGSRRGHGQPAGAISQQPCAAGAGQEAGQSQQDEQSEQAQQVEHLVLELPGRELHGGDESSPQPVAWALDFEQHQLTMAVPGAAFDEERQAGQLPAGFRESNLVLVRRVSYSVVAQASGKGRQLVATQPRPLQQQQYMAAGKRTFVVGKKAGRVAAVRDAGGVSKSGWRGGVGVGDSGEQGPGGVHIGKHLEKVLQGRDEAKSGLGAGGAGAGDDHRRFVSGGAACRMAAVRDGQQQGEKQQGAGRGGVQGAGQGSGGHVHIGKHLEKVLRAGEGGAGAGGPGEEHRRFVAGEGGEVKVDEE